MKLSILVASHGDSRWRELAETRALPSASAQDAFEVLHEHHPTDNRATVRNRLAARASGDWLCFLDADDELRPGYAKHMAVAARPGHLLTPAVSYVVNGKPQKPRFWPETDLTSGNWMVVGTVHERELFMQVGGFTAYMATGQYNEVEDWAHWIRCVKAGAKVTKVPRAVYVAHMLNTSKHRSSSHAQRLAWWEEIRRAEWPELYSV